VQCFVFGTLTHLHAGLALQRADQGDDASSIMAGVGVQANIAGPIAARQRPDGFRPMTGLANGPTLSQLSGAQVVGVMGLSAAGPPELSTIAHAAAVRICVWMASLATEGLRKVSTYSSCSPQLYGNSQFPSLDNREPCITVPPNYSSLGVLS